MKAINKFRTFNKLKSTYRFNSVENRKESSAEHTWSCLILADFFITKFNLKLDKLKVYELLMYHDVVEIEAGDTPLHPNMKEQNKSEKEKKAMKILYKKLPTPLNKKFYNLFEEYEEQKTKESKFAKAIDALDAVIHELDYKEDWKDWSEEFLMNKKLKFLEEFPEVKKIFFEIINYLKENNYFNQ